MVVSLQRYWFPFWAQLPKFCLAASLWDFVLCVASISVVAPHPALPPSDLCLRGGRSRVAEFLGVCALRCVPLGFLRACLCASVLSFGKNAFTAVTGPPARPLLPQYGVMDRRA